MPTYEVELEDGRKFEIDADRQPTNEEAAQIVSSYAQPPESRISPRYGIGVGGKPFLKPQAVGATPPVETFGRQLAEDWESANKPIIPLGKDLTEEQLRGFSPAEQAGLGVAQGFRKAAESLESPASLLTMGGAGAIAKAAPLASKALSAGFAGVMAKQAGEQAGELAGTPRRQMQPAAVAGQIMDTLLTGGMSIAAARDVIAKAKLLPRAAAAAAQAKKGEKNAVPVTGAESLHSHPPPEDSGAVGQRVPPPAPPAEAQAPPKGPPAAPHQETLTLSPEHQAHLDAATSDLDVPVEVVTRPLTEDEPFARQIATIDRAAGKILVNPQQFGRWLEGVPDRQKARAIRSLLSEERIHLATSPEDALRYGDTLTAAEKAIVQRVYAGANGAALSAQDLGYEASRMRTQRLARMDVREAIEASGKEKWKVQSLLALNDIIHGTREALGTKASKECLAILDKVQKNLNAATYAALQAQLSSLSPSQPDFEDSFERILGQMEAIKNRNKGYAPGTEPQEPGAVNKREPDRDEEAAAAIASLQTLQDKAENAGRTEDAEMLRNEIEKLKRTFPGHEQESFPGAINKRKGDETPEFILPPLRTGEQREVVSTGPPPEERLTAGQARAQTALPSNVSLDKFDFSKPESVKFVEPDMLDKPYSLGKFLTKGGGEAHATTKTLSKAVVALERNGEVDLVHAYQDPDDLARLTDPGKTLRERGHVSIRDIMAQGYKPIAGLMLKEPTKSFHQHFDTVKDFEDSLGTPAKEAWQKNQQYRDVDVAAKGFEDKGGEEGVPGRLVPTVEASQPTISDEALSDTHSHFRQFGDAEDAALAIGQSAKAQSLRDIIRYEMEAAFAKNPNLTREQAAREAIGTLYDEANRFATKTFTQRAIGRLGETTAGGYGQAVSGVGPEVAGAEGGALEESPGAINKLTKEEAKLVADDIRGFVAGRKVTDELSKALDSAINTPNIIAAKAENGIRFQAAKRPATAMGRIGKQWTRGDKRVLSAANALVQAQAIRANGSIDNARRSQLDIFQRQVQDGRSKAVALLTSGSWRAARLAKAWIRAADELKSELDYAQAHWNDLDLQKTAAKMKVALDDQWRREQAAGFDVAKDPDYLPKRYDAALWNEHSLIFSGLHELPKILGKKFREAATFDNYYHAISEGPYIPVTRDGASLVSHRIRQGESMLYRDKWTEGVKAVNFEGRPLALDPIKGAHERWLSPDADYDYVPFAGKGLAVLHDFAPLVRNLTSKSQIQDWTLTRNALHTAQILKHSLLAGDFFHFGRVAYYALSIMGKKARWRGGYSVLDIAPEDIHQAVNLGIISPADAAWGRQQVRYGTGTISRRALAEKFYTEMGANVGKIQDALYKDLITDMTPSTGPFIRAVKHLADPTLGRYNRFLFDKWTRGMMMESNVREFERQHAASPDANPEALMRDIARDVNEYFGNIGHQGIIKSATMRDLSRLTFLAPEWVEGLVRKELTAYSRWSGVSSALGARRGVTTMGTTGRGIARGLLFITGLTQAINLITRHQLTFQNQEDGRKLDAWIPGWGADSNGLWFNGLGVFNEITDQLWELNHTKPTFMQAADQVIGNKESPLMKAAIIGLIGSTSGGRQFTTSGGQLGAAASQLAPVPMTFGKLAQATGHAVAPGMVSPPPPASVQRQLASTFGFKTQIRKSPLAEVSSQAQKFAKDNGFKPETGWQEVPTDEASYSKLRTAIRNNDEKEAKKQLDELRKTRSDTKILKAMKQAAKRPFTGSRRGEKAFLDSLDDKGLDAYTKANEQRQAEYEKFEDWYVKQP